MIHVPSHTHVETLFVSQDTISMYTISYSFEAMYILVWYRPSWTRCAQTSMVELINMHDDTGQLFLRLLWVQGFVPSVQF